jgi:alanine dehydrogenase
MRVGVVREIKDNEYRVGLTPASVRATLPHVLALADKGWRQALADDPHLRDGLNVCAGAITHAGLAAALGTPYRPAAEFLGAG